MLKILLLFLLLVFGGSVTGQVGTAAKYAGHSVLSTGNWYKVGISETGVYKLTYSDLSSLGLDMNGLDPHNIRVYHNGGGVLNELNANPRFDDLMEIPIIVRGESDGRFDSNDYVLFYARGPVTWNYRASNEFYAHVPNAYEDYAYAFITADLGPGQRVTTAAQQEGVGETVNTFLDHQVYDRDNYNIINGGRTYYSEIIDGNGSLPLNFEFKNIKADRPCKIAASLAGRNFNPASFQLLVNDELHKTINLTQTSAGSNHAFAYEASCFVSVGVNSDNVKVTLNHIGVVGTTSIGYVDYVSVNAWRSLKYEDSQLLFRNPEAYNPGKVYNYQLSNATSALQVWDVTDSIRPVAVNGHFSGSVYSFKVKGNAKNEFVAFHDASCLSPTLLGRIENQDLHGDRNYDYLMVVYPDFLEQAERLKSIHAEYDPDLKIKIATPQQIYNEFSCGAQDVSAIRDYCKMLYYDSRPLRYLLLFGDASFDYKNRSDIVTFVPTYEKLTASSIQSSIVTDDFFCFMDENEGSLSRSKPDIGAGRFPVSTVEQAAQMVDKVEHYLASNESTMQPWRNVITFMCDDAENNQFFQSSEGFANLIKTTGGQHLLVDKIYLDAYNQEDSPNGQLAPEVNMAVNNRMDKGTLVLNYVGHGGEVQLAEERILKRSDVNSWRNGPKYPLMITGTCEFSRYDDHTRTSLGEYAFLSQYGGMVAMFTTSRVTIAPSNNRFITEVYSHLFEIRNGERLRLGDVFRMAKPDGTENERIYVFFGDPALRLPMPKWTVETINIEDTLKALQPATVEGVVKDLDGQVAEHFNGIVYVSVYDKETVYTTKGDENTPVQEFSLRQSILFNGKTEVVNGRFSISFIVPRDISYRFGKGAVSYYATDYVNDASGLYEDVVIGGYYDDAVMDEEPPQVELFIDDEQFVSGGVTGDSPSLIAYISDDSGINTTGTGIGHDIVATLSGPVNLSYVLNDYFVADMGSQGNGVLTYRMQGLPEGDYILSLKVWDVYNNSSVSSIAFRVVNSEYMVLEEPVCAPNPVNGETYFSFGHNQIGNNMDVVVQIFDMMGRRVTVLHEQITGTSARVNPIYWNGCANNGSQLPSGVYVYSITATNDQKETATVTSKFLIIR